MKTSRQIWDILVSYDSDNEGFVSLRDRDSRETSRVVSLLLKIIENNRLSGRKLERFLANLKTFSDARCPEEISACQLVIKVDNFFLDLCMSMSTTEGGLMKTSQQILDILEAYLLVVKNVDVAMGSYWDSIYGAREEVVESLIKLAKD